jgi:hypothetical protein
MSKVMVATVVLGIVSWISAAEFQFHHGQGEYMLMAQREGEEEGFVIAQAKIIMLNLY